MGKRYFLPTTWLNLRRSVPLGDKVNRQIGVRDFKNVDYFCPGNRSRDTAHAQLLFQITEM